MPLIIATTDKEVDEMESLHTAAQITKWLQEFSKPSTTIYMFSRVTNTLTLPPNTRVPSYSLP